MSTPLPRYTGSGARVGSARRQASSCARAASRRSRLQGLDQAQLAIAQVVGGRRLGRVVDGLHVRGLYRTERSGPAIPVVARAPDQRAVAAPLRPRFLGLGTGQLGERTAAQVAHEDVAVAREGGTGARGVVHRAGGIETGARRIADLHRRAAGHRHLPQVADGRAFALALVERAPAVPRPPGLFHRVADPVRVGHHRVERQRFGRLRGRTRGADDQDGREQGAERGAEAGGTGTSGHVERRRQKDAEA
jgi:hypothetical protein